MTTVRDIKLKARALVSFCKTIKWHNALNRVPKAVTELVTLIGMVTEKLDELEALLKDRNER